MTILSQSYKKIKRQRWNWNSWSMNFACFFVWFEIRVGITRNILLNSNFLYHIIWWFYGFFAIRHQTVNDEEVGAKRNFISMRFLERLFWMDDCTYLISHSKWFMTFFLRIFSFDKVHFYYFAMLSFLKDILICNLIIFLMFILMRKIKDMTSILLYKFILTFIFDTKIAWLKLSNENT